MARVEGGESEDSELAQWEREQSKAFCDNYFVVIMQC